MKRLVAVAIGLALGALTLVASLELAGRASVGAAPTALKGVPQSMGAGEPSQPKDAGTGEELLLVVGGVYPTRQDALAANASISFGDLQGYYVVPASQFAGLPEQLQATGAWALVSAFRTEEGAQEFAQLSESFGVPAFTVPNRVRSLGGVYAGLGQEEDPNGQGPLNHPIPASLS